MLIDRFGDSIFRLRVPFEDLTTSVYFYTCAEGTAIIDAATYPSDVDEYIVKAIDELGLKDIKYLLLTHEHGDHSGGLARLKELFPLATVGVSYETSEPLKRLKDGETVLGDLQVIVLPGHTKDSCGFFDKKSKTLMSGDCLQLKGIGKYRYGVGNKEKYLESVKRLKGMDISLIIAAHEYDPLGSIAAGDEAVEKYLDKCIEFA